MRIQKRYMQNAIKTIFFFCSLLSAGMLIFILWEIVIQAVPSLSWYFLATAESDTPRLGMAIGNAILGTVLISLCATILAAPFAIFTAIYLQKYSSDTYFVRLIRFFIEVLSGTPSIVLGIFGLIFLVAYLKPITGGFSLISGSIALSILIMPVIERATEDAFQRVPTDLEEASYSLGASKWETIKHVTIPVSLNGIITGTILGFGRAAEESAVVILTAGYSQFFPEFAVKYNEKLLFNLKFYPFQDVIGTLPYSVYHAYENSNIVPLSNGFAAAFILIIFIFFINICVKFIFRNN